MNKNDLKRTEQWLDERWLFVKHDEHGKAILDVNETYYRGAIDTIVFLGMSWKRNADGKHLLFK